MLRQNVGGIDRIVRLVAGILLLAAGLFVLEGGALRIAAIVVGALGLVTGSVRFCPVYLPFKLSTRRKAA